MSPPSEPLLSILVPTYNYADYIGEAITSLIAQGVAGVEVVVADDGSTDGTKEALSPWIESGEVRYFYQENGGPASARNLAMTNARGKYLMFMDADDELVPGCMAVTLEFLERHPEVGLFFTNYDIFDEKEIVAASGVDIWKVFRQIPHREVEPDGWIFTTSLAPYIIRHGAFMHTSGLTLRREVAEQIGPFQEGYSYGEDDEFYARAAYNCTAGYVDRVLSRKRNHTRSIIHDPLNRLRNGRHSLELTEIQRTYYREDAQLQAIIDEKARARATAYVWLLIEVRGFAEARVLLREYLSRYPGHWTLYKLLAKALLLGALKGESNSKEKGAHA